MTSARKHVVSAESIPWSGVVVIIIEHAVKGRVVAPSRCTSRSWRTVVEHRRGVIVVIVATALRRTIAGACRIAIRGIASWDGDVLRRRGVVNRRCVVRHGVSSPWHHHVGRKRGRIVCIHSTGSETAAWHGRRQAEDRGEPFVADGFAPQMPEFQDLVDAILRELQRIGRLKHRHQLCLQVLIGFNFILVA